MTSPRFRLYLPHLLLFLTLSIFIGVNSIYAAFDEPLGSIFGSTTDHLLDFYWDDTLYYTQISRNIALGNGPTFDGINWTNGFQPLWGLLLVPVYWFFPDSLDIPLWIVFLLHLVFLTFSVILLFRILVREYGSEIASFGALVVLWPGFNLLMGMEQAIFVLIHSALAYWLVFDIRKSWLGRTNLRAVFLGLLGGGLFLTRTDSLIMLVSIWAGWSLFNLHSHPRADAKWRHAGIRLGLSVIASAPMGLGYAIWNQVNFGHLLPISSALKSSFPHPQFLLARIQALKWSYLGGLILFIFLILYLRRLKRRNHTSVETAIAMMSPGVLLYLLFVALFVDFGGNYNQLAVIVVPASLTVAIFLQLLLSAISPTLPKLTYLLPLIGLSISIMGFSFLRLHTWSNTIGSRSAFLGVTSWAAETTPADAVFAFEDSTFLGYFSGRHTINLDGLVNNWDYQNALQNGKFGDYAKEMGIDYLVTWWWRDMELNGCVDYTLLSRISYPDLPTEFALPEDALVHIARAPEGAPINALLIWDYKLVIPNSTCGEYELKVN